MIEAEPIPEGSSRPSAPRYGALAEAATAARGRALVGDRRGHRASASFAGMNETFLNVAAPTPSSMPSGAAGPRCSAPARSSTAPSAASARPTWTSPSSSSARSLDARRGDVHDRPRDRRDDRLVIEGSFGLGEAVVSGSVSPDRYVVDKDDAGDPRREVRRKELVIEAVPTAAARRARARPDEARRAGAHRRRGPRIADLGRRDRGPLRRAAGHRVGVRPRGHVWMLQSRPVTVDRRGAAEPAAEAAAASAGARPRRGARAGLAARPRRRLARRGPSSATATSWSPT